MTEPFDTEEPSPTVAAACASSSTRSKDLTGQILDFLSNASNETLGACIAGLGAATYLVLGRVGLVLIGVACGIAFHASWERTGEDDGFQQRAGSRRKKAVGLDVVKRLLDARNRKHPDRLEDVSATHADQVQVSPHEKLDFAHLSPESAESLGELVDAIVNNYIKWWYTPLLPSDTSFPFASRQTLTAFILAFISHVSKKRPADMFLTFLINGSSILIVFLSELSSALTAPGSNSMRTADAIQAYLEDNRDSNLANVLDRKEQEKKLKIVADDILQTFLDPKAYNCEPARVFFREVLSGLILEPTLQSCSKSDWINGWIVYLLEEGEPEIMNAISTGVEDATASNITRPSSGSRRANDRSPLVEEAPHTKAASMDGQPWQADDATRMAMLEAKRLSEMIAAEEASRIQGPEDYVPSAPSTNALPTPTSSQSDLPNMSQDRSLEYNAIPETEEQVLNEIDDAGSRDVDSTSTPTFTDFDQLSLPLRPEGDTSHPLPLTLHNAKVQIFDDSQPGEKSSLRSKPVAEYLLQVEPASSNHAGWMIARKYVDFETLHEVLRRISVISGIPGFTIKYTTVPTWKTKTKTSLRLDLEVYLSEALSHLRLAESEGMKRFLEKDQALGKLSDSKATLGFPSPEAFQSVGKGMLDVLASAPKGAAGGGKALLEGVSGVFQKRSSGRPASQGSKRMTSSDDVPRQPAERSSSHSRPESNGYVNAALGSLEDAHSISQAADNNDRYVTQNTTEMSRPMPLQSRPSGDAFTRRNALGFLGGDNSVLQKDDMLTERMSLAVGKSVSDADQVDDVQFSLPPPPSEIPDGYEPTLQQSSDLHNSAQNAEPSFEKSGLSDGISSVQTHLKETEATESRNLPLMGGSRVAKSPVTMEETQMVVELLFAVISELYTLSSVWTIRRTLFNAAKTFMLRPNNPSLEAVRVLLQEQGIDANTSDAGIALHLKKMRENSMPTEEELAKWPPPLSTAESRELRFKARRLLLQQGIPPALKGVMGSSASSEALARVFDSLQVEHFSRGLIFALMLQFIKAVTH